MTARLVRQQHVQPRSKHGHDTASLLFFLIGTISVLVTGPQGQVITKQLHDKSRVLVRFFVQSIQLGNSIIKGLLGDLASLVRGVKNLVVEDRKVKGKSKTDGVCWWKIRGGNSTGGLVSIKGSSGRFLADIANLELGKVTVLN